MSSREFLTIGEVAQRLTVEFPDLSVSKLRYLEDEGLVYPARTPSGYRKYSKDDVERVRTILLLQRDQFLPLQVIKTRLADPGAATILPEAEPEVEDVESGLPNRLPLRGAAQETGIAETFIKELSDYRVIEIEIERVGPTVDRRDLEVIRLAAELKRLGVEPRHLRMYVTFATKEAQFFGQILGPTFRHKTPESKALLTERLDLIEDQLLRLRTRLFSHAVRDELKDLL